MISDIPRDPSALGILRWIADDIWQAGKRQWNKLIQNGDIRNSQVYQNSNYDSLIDICLIVVLIGLILRIAGEEEYSRKFTGLGFLAAIILKVVSIV